MSKKTSVARLVAAVLLAVCAIGMLHAARAAVASVLYCRSRYGALATDAEKIQRACRLAHALYPFDYYACIWAGKTALHGRAGDASARRQDLADRWSERGVRLNPLNGELVQLRVDALFPTAPDEAVALWERHVAFAFWNRYHQVVLFRLYVRTGRLDDAEAPLYWIRGTVWFADAERTLNEALRRR